MVGKFIWRRGCGGWGWGFGGCWWAPVSRGSPAVELELIRDRGEVRGDLRGEDEQSGNHDDCDQRQEDAILGHRLTLLALEVGQVDPRDQVAEIHAFAPPFCGVGGTNACVGREAGGGHGNETFLSVCPRRPHV